jgi:hypothetical protein
MQWFGDSWGAPVCDETAHVATPTGQPCLYCKKAILAEDIGFLIPCVRETVTTEPWHYECLVQSLNLDANRAKRLAAESPLEPAWGVDRWVDDPLDPHAPVPAIEARRTALLLEKERAQLVHLRRAMAWSILAVVIMSGLVLLWHAVISEYHPSIPGLAGFWLLVVAVSWSPVRRMLDPSSVTGP